MDQGGSPFYHLHLHTEFSLLDGAIRLDSLFQKCIEYGMDAVSMTDHGTMFGVAEFYEKAKKKSIKPVIGCEVYVAPRTLNDRTPLDSKGLSHLVLLAKDREGYANLCKLVSIAQLKGFYYKPRIDRELLRLHSKGLIGLSACLKGDIPKNILQNRMDAADDAARFYLNIFGEDNFFLEVQENGMPVQHKVNEGLLDISQRLSIPMVATNDCHYLSKGDDKAHEILLCIQTGDTFDKKDRFKFDSDQLYFKSSEEMIKSLGQYSGAIENTRLIVSRCNVEFDDKTYHFPRYAISPDESEDELFKKKAMEGFEDKLKRIKTSNHDIDEKVYRDRIEYEIGVILGMGFSGYFLIVADFIGYSRKIGVPVGPGRGSAAGSMVAYAMDITALDPIEHGLIFERFLNPSRISMPDIDVDFCIEGRDKVYQYVIDRYGGPEYVCQIITFGRLKAKAVIRDVGRAIGVLLSEVDEIAKMIPDNAKNLEKAIEEVPMIREKCSESTEKSQMLEISMLLEGLPRHASTHAAGVVVSDKPLNEYLPLYKGKDGETLTQFDMNYVEKLGLVKFDFLGLRNLTVIKNCMELIKNQGKTPPDFLNLDYTDEKTFELLQRADTTGVFQLESSGMKDLILRLKPGSFSDIVALVALYRPGPLDSGMADTYVERKHGREEVIYLFDELEPILKETYGVILYQEQVMKIAGVLANYSMADADGLRKAMGKKIASMMEAHRELFLKGAKENRRDLKKASELFDLMEKFGGYGFNKSHSAAYALIAYQTAYLKANFALEFIAALMTSEKGNSDAVIKYMEECRTHEIKVLPPDVNKSNAHFTVSDGCIRFGLAAVKNIGEAAIESIVEARKNSGEFKNLYDFCEQVNVGKVNKKVVEALIKCGAFDSTQKKRSQMMAVLEDALDHGSRIQKEKADSQLDLFADSNMGALLPVSTPVLPEIEEWDDQMRLSFEKESLGFYVSGHPLDKYKKIIQKYTSVNSINIHDISDGKMIRMAGTIKPLKLHKTKKGDMMAFAAIEDQSGSIEVVVFPDLYAGTHQYIVDEAIVILEALVQKKENIVKLIAEKIVPIDKASEEWASGLIIKLDAKKNSLKTLEELKTILKKFPGDCPTFLNIEMEDTAPLIMKLADDYHTATDSCFYKEIEELIGEGRIETTCSPVKEKQKIKKNWKKKQTGN
ncbi:MAG: DNA polymerase III subunit alpha [Desulfobacterales bacterium RIFOXYA12_FULL_46_15]|nr:MAG: DNA polymerase III subunit alpha [Desulfobacterales bacterium RIFOXYA12_FULL_46_15]